MKLPQGIPVPEGFEILNHKGKEIMYLNFSLTDGPQQIEKCTKIVQFVHEVIKDLPPDSIGVLGNYTNFHFNMDIMNAMKADMGPMDRVARRTSIYGVTGLIKVAYNFVVGMGFKKKWKVFENLEEAKDWAIG